MGNYVSGEYAFEDQEPLGRCCFDSADSGKTRARTRFIRRGFVERIMSVDELLLADQHHLVYVHGIESRARRQPQRFHGWYVFGVNVPLSNAGDVQHGPTLNNPWHAEVISPHPDLDRDEFIQLCEKIASATNWRSLPFISSDEDFLNQVSQALP